MNDVSPKLTELSTSKSPQTNPEIQEALSKRYSICAIVTPLSSGKFAVFSNDRSMDGLVICESDDLHLVIPSRANLSPKRTNVPRNVPSDTLNAIDFSDL